MRDGNRNRNNKLSAVFTKLRFESADNKLELN